MVFADRANKNFDYLQGEDYFQGEGYLQGEDYLQGENKPADVLAVREARLQDVVDQEHLGDIELSNICQY